MQPPQDDGLQTAQQLPSTHDTQAVPGSPEPSPDRRPFNQSSASGHTTPRLRAHTACRASPLPVVDVRDRDARHRLAGLTRAGRLHRPPRWGDWPTRSNCTDRRAQAVDRIVRSQHPTDHRDRSEAAGRVDERTHQSRMQKAGVLADLLSPRHGKSRLRRAWRLTTSMPHHRLKAAILLISRRRSTGSVSWLPASRPNG